MFEAKTPGIFSSFGFLPWWRSPDTIILAFLQAAKDERHMRGAFKLPLDGFSVGQVYQAASEEDLAKLNKVSAI